MAIDDALPVEARVRLKNPRLNELNVPMETAARRARPRVSSSADDGAGECLYHRAGICGTAPPDVTCAQTASSEAWRLRNTSQSWRRVTEQAGPRTPPTRCLSPFTPDWPWTSSPWQVRDVFSRSAKAPFRFDRAGDRKGRVYGGGNRRGYRRGGWGKRSRGWDDDRRV